MILIILIAPLSNGDGDGSGGSGLKVGGIGTMCDVSRYGSVGSA